MIDAMVERLARMQQHNDSRTQRQMDEMEMDVKAAQKARHDKTRADLIATHISRQKQLKWKSDAKQQEQLERDHFASQLGALNERLRAEELAKTLADRKERERLDDFLFDQMAQRQGLELAERLAEVHEAEHIDQFLEVRARAARAGWQTLNPRGCLAKTRTHACARSRAPCGCGRSRARRGGARAVARCSQDEEAVFQQYAKMCVAELREEGKSTKPIELLLSKKEKLFD
jgi:hypothetical protein